MSQTQKFRPVATRAALIDEFGELSRRIAEFKPAVERHKQLKDEIESWYAGQAGYETFVEDGGAYSVHISARAHERKILSMDRLYKKLGKWTFLQWCTFPLGAVDKLCSDTNGILLCERTGRRKIEAVARIAAKAA